MARPLFDPRDAGLGALHLLDRTVLVVFELVHADGAPVDPAARKPAVVVDEIPVALELNDGLVVRLGIGKPVVDHTSVFPWSGDALAGRVFGG